MKSYREIILPNLLYMILFEKYIQGFLVHVFVQEWAHFTMYLLARTNDGIATISEFGYKCGINIG